MKLYYSNDLIRIYHADCIEALHELDAEWDVMITDPPYGIAYSPGYRSKNAYWTRNVIANDETTAVRDTAMSFLRGRPALVFGTWYSPRPPIPIKEILIWYKGPLVGMGDLGFVWKRSYEEIYVSGDGWVGKRSPSVLLDLWDTPSTTRHNTLGRFHQNQKPVKLMRYLVEHTPPEWRVIDPFMGSGSTLFACAQIGRPAIGIDVEEMYCEAAARVLELDWQGLMRFNHRLPAAGETILDVLGER